MNIEITKPTRLLTGGKACPEDIDILPVMQTKEVTENGIVVPDSGYLGFSRVTVNVPEPADTVLENIANPIMPKFGRLKYIEHISIGQNAVRYKDTFPAGTDRLSPGVYTDGLATTADTHAEAWFLRHRAGAPNPETERFVCDGKVYDAHKYCTDIVALWDHIYQNGEAHTPLVRIPPCLCRIALYHVASKTIETQEYVLNDLFIAEQYQPKVDSKYTVALGYLNVHFAAGGYYPIGAEFVYEKHNVTFSGGNAALKYSTDDGVTFASVTDGLTLNQVEHVVFQNESSETLFLKLTDGNSVNLTPGCTFAVVVEEDVTWKVETSI